jgi:alcohol dehydrogenase YqhD (iron-dependent ADH family)
MLGNFSYSNPTTLHFGKDALNALPAELTKVGRRVLLVYGGGSIKKSGLYDKIIAILRESGKEVAEDSGVMPNPTIDKLYEGIERARAHRAEFILAVGGGSVCDYSKALAASVCCDKDPWEEFFVRQQEPANPVLPVGCVLTMVGTGSEMNGGAVITNPRTHEKIGKVFSSALYPRFTILNPEFTFTLPKYQMVAGFFDIMSHILEQYFSGEDDNTSDYLSEGLMRSLIHSSRIAVKNPSDYEARSNIMWTATWALNTLIGQGKTQDWMVHMIGQSVGGSTDATHGMTLSAVSLPYYRLILDAGLPKFKRFAENVWNVSGAFATDREIAEEGLRRMQSWMEELGLVMHLKDLGVTEELLPQIADNTFLLQGGYRELTRADVLTVLKESL